MSCKMTGDRNWQKKKGRQRKHPTSKNWGQTTKSWKTNQEHMRTGERAQEHKGDKGLTQDKPTKSE